MENNNKIDDTEFHAVDFMRKIRIELSEKYLQNKEQYMEDLKKAMEDFKRKQESTFSEQLNLK